MNSNTGNFNAKLIVIISFTLALFAPLSIDLYIPTLPAIGEEFNRSAELSLSVFLIMLGVGQLFLGNLYDKYGPKGLVVISLTCFMVSSSLIAISSSYEGFILLRAIQGVAVSGLALTSLAIIRDNFPFHETAKYFGYLNSVINIIPSIAPFLGVYLLSQTGDWRACFSILAILAILVLPFISFNIKNVPYRPQPSGFSLKFVSNTDYLKYAPIAVMSLALILVYVTIAPKLFIEKYEWSTTFFSALFAINGFFMFLTGFLFARLTRIFPIEKLMNIGLAIQIASISCFALYGISVVFLAIGFALHSIAFCFMISSGTALSLRSMHRDIGKAISLITCLQMICGGAAGALIVILPFDIELLFGILLTVSVIYTAALRLKEIMKVKQGFANEK